MAHVQLYGCGRCLTQPQAGRTDLFIGAGDVMADEDNFVELMMDESADAGAAEPPQVAGDQFADLRHGVQ